MRKSIENVLAQTLQDWDLIIVDDGSTDTTATVAQEYVRPGIRYVYQANQGVAIARNAGLDVATAEFVAFLDADDWWSQDGLAVLAKALGDNPGAAVAHGDWAYVDSSGVVGQRRSSVLRNGEGLETLLALNPFPVHAALVRRPALEAVGGFCREAPTLEDWELWLRLAAASYRFVHVPQLVAYYYWHPGSKSKNIARRKAERLGTLDRFWRDNGHMAVAKELSHRSYATAYLDTCVARLAQADTEQALAEFRLAVDADRTMLGDLDTYYRIAYAEQSANEATGGGLHEELNEPAAVQRIESVLTYSAGMLAGQPDAVAALRSARSAAYHALGRACYNEGRLDRARVYLWRATRCRPAAIAREGLGYTMVKACLPRPLLEAARRLRRREL